MVFKYFGFGIGFLCLGSGYLYFKYVSTKMELEKLKRTVAQSTEEKYNNRIFIVKSFGLFGSVCIIIYALNKIKRILV